MVIYDINRPGVELGRLHEHNRQVHRLAFNSHQGALLLSGSQDATVRLWDLRQLSLERSAMTCRSTQKYSLNNEAIRDLRWSPTNGVEFAAGTEHGVIQRWDFRKDKSPLLKINAHEKTCHSIDWHPDGKHLVSGGADKNVKIWDFSSTDRRMKACWQLRAPQAVLSVRWRPPCWVAHPQGPGSWQAVQLATSYDSQDPRIHIWDFRRPFMPFREIDRYTTPPAAMLWRSENLLWSVGVSGMFTQTDISYTSKLLDQRTPSVITTASGGQVGLFLEERLERRKTLEDASGDFLQGKGWPGGSGERLSGSHSITDGSYEEPSLLSTSFKSRQRKSHSTRSNKSVTSTPPSAGVGGPVLNLDESLQNDLLYRPSQAAATGHFPSIFDDKAFRFLARNYGSLPIGPLKQVEWNLHEILGNILEDNAALAARAGQQRLAQSWRILAMVVRKELKARAETNFALRKAGKRASQGPIKPSSSEVPQVHGTGPFTSNKEGAPNILSVPQVQEHDSNMTTPLARPISDLSIETEKARTLANSDEETFKLPIPGFSKQSPKKHNTVSDLARLKGLEDVNIIGESQQKDPENHASAPLGFGETSTQIVQTPPPSGFPDLEYHMSERRAAMNNYKAQPRPPLRLDDPFHIQREGLSAPSFGRHDSNESFQMFSASSDSSHRDASVTGSFGTNRASDRSGSTPERSKAATSTACEGHLDDTNAQILLEGDESRMAPQDNPIPTDYLPTAPDSMVAGNHSPAKPPTLIRPLNPQAPIIHAEDLDIPEDPANTSPTDKGYFIASDFEPPEIVLAPKPWTATAMLPPLISYHTATLSDSQTPAHLLLYLLPYFTLSIPRSLIISIFLSYHNQLTSLNLHAQAAHIRNLCYPTYPEIYDHGTYGITLGGAWCTLCRKPNKGDKRGYCERCRKGWAPCPVCGDEGPIASARSITVKEKTGIDDANPSASDTLQGWCHGCGHGGHIGCLKAWWDDPTVSEGGCPTMGCLHDCVAGIRRDEMLRKAAEDKKAGTVKGDDWVVGESRAAEKARDLLGAGSTRVRGGHRREGQGQTSAGGISGGQGPLSAGLGGRSHSGSGSIGKKVRLVVPEGAGEVETNDVKDVTSASAP